MGYWGDVCFAARVYYPEDPSRWFDEKEKKALAKELFNIFYPFSRYEGGLDFDFNTAFEPD